MLQISWKKWILKTAPKLMILEPHAQLALLLERQAFRARARPRWLSRGHVMTYLKAARFLAPKLTPIKSICKKAGNWLRIPNKNWTDWKSSSINIYLEIYHIKKWNESISFCLCQLDFQEWEKLRLADFWVQQAKTNSYLMRNCKWACLRAERLYWPTRITSQICSRLMMQRYQWKRAFK